MHMQQEYHGGLECLSSIAKSKWHLDKLEKSKWGGYSSLGNVIGGYWDLVVGLE